MKKTKTLTPDQKSERVRQIEAELGIDMLEKFHTAFMVLAEAMVHRAVRKAELRAYSERCRSAFRTDGDHDSKLMPITIPK